MNLILRTAWVMLKQLAGCLLYINGFITFLTPIMYGEGMLSTLVPFYVSGSITALSFIVFWAHCTYSDVRDGSVK